MKFKYIYISIVPLIAALILSAFNSSANSPDEKRNDKLIKFSHSFHADLAECADCHSAVLTSTSLKDRMMPNHDDCSSCHDVEDADNCNTCHYEDTYESLIQTKSDLFFDHQFHIEEQKVECQSCHKGISEVDYSWQAVQPHPVMEDCYSCHNDTEVATNACESCHISTAGLIPQSHKSSSFITAHKFAARDLDANCMMCHDQNNNSCETCHAANSIITETNVPNDFYQPYEPSNFIDGTKQQKLSRVHELGYRFTHGIDAKNNTTECQSCHQTETFCASCHQSEGSDFALGGIMPASHLKPNFAPSSQAGTGGGEHATLARRNIEQCASCHDTQGADPTCIRCHIDIEGIPDPKTHQRGFMSDVRGDWHDNAGSICYNCHFSASPNSMAGFGFCGYCHGQTN